MTMLIPLTKGQFAIVDDDEFDHLLQFQWHLDGNYAIRSTPAKARNPMQYDVLGFPQSMLIDHINGDGLDNRRENLRPCTQHENTWNTKKRTAACSSQFKGVCFHKTHNIYQAYITFRGTKISLGHHEDETTAARAYDRAAYHYFGDFARLNFPNETPALLIKRERSTTSHTVEFAQDESGWHVTAFAWGDRSHHFDYQTERPAIRKIKELERAGYVFTPADLATTTN